MYISFPREYKSLAQSINQGHICPSRSLKTRQIKKIKNLHVYYEKDNIQLLHLNLINMRLYGAENNNIERGDQYY